MLTLLLCLILVANNRYLINFSLLILTAVIVHASLSLNYLTQSKLLFNSYLSYDNLTLSVLIISGLITL